MNRLIWLILLLLVTAIVLKSELFFYLLYLLVGMQLVAQLWLRRTSRRLSWSRRAPETIFPGEQATVTIAVQNESLLPVPWLSIHESLPPALRTPPMVREVISLGAGEQRELQYAVMAQHRGYYRLGPLTLQTGDVLGFGERVIAGSDTAGLTVFPQVLPLAELGLPAALPFGVLAAPQSLFMDPARPAGTRPYQAADGIRRIDWKATARADAPMVRWYQPAIALETLVAPAFTREEYPGRYALDSMEHAITAAASIAAYLVEQRQPVGLLTNGRDPAADNTAAVLPPANGRAQLMELLAILGRLEPGAGPELPTLLARATAHLGWGSTVVLITGQHGESLISALLPLRRRGLRPALVLADPTAADLELARQHGIVAFELGRGEGIGEKIGRKK